LALLPKTCPEPVEGNETKDVKACLPVSVLTVLVMLFPSTAVGSGFIYCDIHLLLVLSLSKQMPHMYHLFLCVNWRAEKCYKMEFFLSAKACIPQIQRDALWQNALYSSSWFCRTTLPSLRQAQDKYHNHQY
jgi:hypothetical protein